MFVVTLAYTKKLKVKPNVQAAHSRERSLTRALDHTVGIILNHHTKGRSICHGRLRVQGAHVGDTCKYQSILY